MSSPIRPGWLSGGRFGRPKGTVEEQRQAEGLDRYIRRDRQQPGDLAPARRHQAGRIEAGVCVFMLCVIGTVFDVKRLVVVMMVLGILPMQRHMLDFQRPLGNAL